MLHFSLSSPLFLYLSTRLPFLSSFHCFSSSNLPSSRPNLRLYAHFQTSFYFHFTALISIGVFHVGNEKLDIKRQRQKETERCTGVQKTDSSGMQLRNQINQKRKKKKSSCRTSNETWGEVRRSAGEEGEEERQKDEGELAFRLQTWRLNSWN